MAGERDKEEIGRWVMERERLETTDGLQRETGCEKDVDQ